IVGDLAHTWYMDVGNHIQREGDVEEDVKREEKRPDERSKRGRGRNPVSAMEPRDHPAADEEPGVDPDWDNVTDECPRSRALTPVNPVIADQDAVVQTPLNKIEQRPSSEEVQDQCHDADADGAKRHQPVRPDVFPGADNDRAKDLQAVPEDGT